MTLSCQPEDTHRILCPFEPPVKRDFTPTCEARCAIVTGITTSLIEVGEMLKEIRRPNGRLILLRQIAFGPGVMTA